MDVRRLAIDLAIAEKENDVVKILKKNGFWDDERYWHPLGNLDNNFSVIGNQQSKPDSALVEKLINSVDAILMKECLSRNIEMTSKEAPQSITEALNTFFGIREGQISFLDTKTKNLMAQDIILAATGTVNHMNIVLVDRGEGQTPNSMPDTILSISRNNKLSVPFVQGKYNMGGTGALPFCGNHRLQLIISKRCPDIPSKGDRSFSEWSVTVVRREEAREGRRSSMYTYLTDLENRVLRYKADALPIIPTTHGQPPENMEYGRYIKLFNYSFPGYKSNVLFDFNYRLAMLIPELAHPVRIRECRGYYKGHTLETTLSGLITRLSEDKRGNLEDNFPSSETFYVDGQQFKCSIYVFKPDKSKNYREKDGILYIVNGQTHATARESFFNRVNLSYLADSILVLVDCSKVDITHREDMFMNSRDRLRGGSFVKDVEERIKELLSNHSGLKKLQHDRREEAVREKLEDDKPLEDVLQHILNKSPVLSKILLSGKKLSNPFDLSNKKGKGENFVGKKHPSFFTLQGRFTDGLLHKLVPINHSLQVKFETDAENEYFSRPDEQGQFYLLMNGKPCPELIRHLGLFNGIATLTVTLPINVTEGDHLEFTTALSDEFLTHDFSQNFYVTVGPPENSSSGKPAKKISPPGDMDKQNRIDPGLVNLPNIIERHKDDWNTIGMNESSGLFLMSSDEGSDYHINMDNKYLLTELKALKESEIQLARARYKYGLVLIALSVESYYKTNENIEFSYSMEDAVKEITSIVAPILIPLIDSMSELEETALVDED